MKNDIYFLDVQSQIQCIDSDTSGSLLVIGGRDSTFGFYSIPSFEVGGNQLQQIEEDGDQTQLAKAGVQAAHRLFGVQ
jgi:hypothetical protein